MKNKENLNFSKLGQWTLDSTPDDSLEKKLKNFAAAAALLGNLSNISPSNLNKPSTPTSPISQEKQMHPDLDKIAFIESSSGKNLKHSVVNKGLNKGDRAGGAFGMMPITAKETIEKNNDLKNKYGHVLSLPHANITNFLNNNADASKQLASAHFDRLLKIFPNDALKRAYAWNNGITGALKASKADVTSHPYVKKFASHSSNREIASK